MLRVMLALAFTAGCVDGYTPEPFEVADTTIRKCSTTSGYQVFVSGTVIDFETRAPVAGAPIEIAEAWQTNGTFPTATCSVATTTSGPDGRFGLAVTMPGTRPGLFDDRYVLFLVQSEDRAPVASDNRISCPLSGTCAVEGHVLPSPTVDLARYWRSDLQRGGMHDVWTRGLIAFEFRDKLGRPAAGAVPRRELLFDDDDELQPGSEVRYLDGDRGTLTEPDTRSTTGSGLALISFGPGAEATIDVAASGPAGGWPGTGCLIGTGWIFVEDRRVPTE